MKKIFDQKILHKNFLDLFSFPRPVLPLPGMEFLDVNLTEDSILLLYAIHSPFNWRILIKPFSALVLKLHIHKNPRNKTTRVYSCTVWFFVEWNKEGGRKL